MSTLPPPVCLECGKAVGSSYEPYKKLLQSGMNSVEAIKHFPQFKKRCCITRLITHIDNMDEQSTYMPQQRIKMSLIDSFTTNNTSSSYLRPDQITTYFQQLEKEINKQPIQEEEQKEKNKKKQPTKKPKKK